MLQKTARLFQSIQKPGIPSTLPLRYPGGIWHTRGQGNDETTRMLIVWFIIATSWSDVENLHIKFLLAVKLGTRIRATRIHLSLFHGIIRPYDPQKPTRSDTESLQLSSI